MTDKLLQSLPDLSGWMVHLFLVGSTIIENVFPPWPGDTFVVFAGMLTVQGIISFSGAILSTLIGNLIGAWIMFFAGEGLLALARSTHSKLKHGLLKWLLEELVSDTRMEKTEAWFRRWGAWFVMISRFSAGVRFFVSIIAGISRMNLLLFTVTFGIGATIWNLLLLSGGRLLAENWRRVLQWLQIYNLTAGILIAILIVVLLWRVYRKQSA